MAVVKVCKGGGSIGRCLDYAGKENRTSGKDCPDNAKDAYKQMQLTKEIHDQTEGRQYKHYIQSFDPHDNITPEKANELGREWAEKCFPCHEAFIGTHTDRDHIHNHIIVNSVNFENGKKIQVSSKDLKRFKQENDHICEREGLSVPESGQRKEITTWNMNKQKLLERINRGENVKSYVLDTAIAVQSAARRSISKDEFIKEMLSMGYKTNWQDHRQNVTFTNQSGHKVRLKNLERTFKDGIFTKEGLHHEFQRFKEQSREVREGGRGFTESRGGSHSLEFRRERIGQVSQRCIEASRAGAVDQSISNIKRTLQQLENRARGFNEGARQKGRGFNGKQRILRESDQERDL